MMSEKGELEELMALKAKGNKAFTLASKQSGNSTTAKQLYIDACFCYVQLLEKIVSVEMLELTTSATDELALLRPQTLFNLAMANFHLRDFRSCIQCCNAAIMFCNDNSLMVCSMGGMEMLNGRVQVLEPVVSQKKYIFATQTKSSLF
jgi:hypothetical protein